MGYSQDNLLATYNKKGFKSLRLATNSLEKN